ncbi:MAG: hypothetical protein IJ463_07320 [Bacilli bacterium]|nr:hypothetical protein [Bacilli bacterium]
MKKIIILFIIIIILVLGGILGYKAYINYKIEHTEKIVILHKDKIDVFENIKLKDLIKEINGELEENPKIKTTKIGKYKLKFKYYIPEEKITVPYEIEYEVVDSIPPIISMINSKTVTVGTKEIESSLFCGDNYDSKPNCFIEGNYDLNTVGEYKLTYKGIDSSNNEVKKDFTLYVKPKTTSSSNNNTTRSKTYFTDIVKNYKTENTKIGLDVSHWQGNINFQKVKDAGVEFVYIRIGRGNGIGKEFVMDSKFKQNIEGFNSVGIPVGLYFYTYAASKKDAIKEAKWIVENIKDYKVDLEIAFDWENWSFYRDFNLSFYELTEVAKAFNKELAKHNYQGMLYSSKNYLENMWFEVDFPVWLAHYTKQTSYQGKYKVWQICDNGVVDGIPDNQVDINIMYN